MKTAIKTALWTIISGAIFFLSAWMKGIDAETAAFATLCAVLAKTPFYSAFEFSFERFCACRESD